MSTFMSRVRRLIAAGALALCALAPAQAATFTRYNQGRVILMSGQIEDGDAAQLELTIRGITLQMVLVEWLFLDSPGGTTQGGVDLAKVVGKYKLNTAIGTQGACASACVTVFALGARKVVYPTSRIGVHGGSERNMQTGETRFSPEATLKMIRLYNTLGVPASVLVKIAVTPPEQLAWLDANEYRAWGVEMLQPAPGLVVPKDRRPLY